jgi:uncharacterized flavoprotein (TIGR03862 family)
MSKKKICVIGTGPAGLMAGTTLLERGYEVHFFDHKKAAGRKFLVAGHGGFNLTHSEPSAVFIEKFTHPFIQSAFTNFDNFAWINWLKKIGIETFTGSSGKIFPLKGIKPIEVLSAWMERITQLGGLFHFSHKFVDFDEKKVTFIKNSAKIEHSYDFLILALGGNSWRKTGSTGEWKELLIRKGVVCEEFESSNSGFEFEQWNELSELEGQTIKNIEASYGSHSKKGDVVISKYGLEGAPIYFLNKAYRENRNSLLSIDLKPTKTKEELQQVLKKAKNTTEGLKALKLSKATILLLKQKTTKEEYASPQKMAENIKSLKFSPSSLRPIDEVISTIGGISMDAITESFELKTHPNVFVCGEMLDWDAPTGGYLIQGAVSTGFMVGNSI